MKWEAGMIIEGGPGESQFELVRWLADNQAGAVWLAHKTRGDRIGTDCVLKQIDAGVLDADELREVDRRHLTAERIGREAAAKPNAVGYQNVVRIYGSGNWKGDRYLEMEYVEGESLKQRLTGLKGAPLPAETVLAFALQLCDSLIFLEKLPGHVSHRDIKASNIMLTKSAAPVAPGDAITPAPNPPQPPGEAGKPSPERLVLIDLEGARMIDDSRRGPYQYKEEEQEDPAAKRTHDIYLAALVIAEMKLGRSIAAELESNSKRVDKVIPGSDPLTKSLQRALAERAEDRPATADAFRRALTTPQNANLRGRLIAALTGSEREVDRRVPEDMAVIPSGRFMYGAERDDLLETGKRTNQPKAAVRPLDQKGYCIDRTPVTNRQYLEFVRQTNRREVPYSDSPFARPYNWDRRNRVPPEGMEDHPVVLVTYAEAAAYAAFNQKRLPTEREWEKAARGLDGRLYPWGSDWDRTRCNNLEEWLGRDLADTATWKYYMKAVLFDLENWVRTPAAGIAPAFTTPVGRYLGGASFFGVLDMVGNVWEWTADAPPENKDYRVLRGGSWLEGPVGNRVTARLCELSGARVPWVGFRCAQDIAAKS